MVNRINAQGWIVLNVLSLQNAGRVLFRSVSNHFVGICATPTEDYFYENDVQETEASRRALKQLISGINSTSLSQQVTAGEILSQS